MQMQDLLIKKIIYFIDNKILSLRDLDYLPEMAKDKLYNKMFSKDFCEWQKQMYYCQAELQVSLSYDSWSSWFIYYNIDGSADYYDEIIIKVDTASEPIEITPHENLCKWKAYKYFLRDNPEFMNEEEFLDDYDY